MTDDDPILFAYLAATYANLGETSAAREALSRCRALTSQPIADLVAFVIHDRGHLKQRLDGISLADGESHSDGTEGTQ